MPIRMKEDNPRKKRRRERRQNRQSNSNMSSGGGLSNLLRGGGKGGLGSLIGTLLPFLMKKPKLLIGIIVVGGILYFLFGRGCTSFNTDSPVDSISNFIRGGEMDKEIYDEVEIFEPLADNKKNPLPEKVSLKEYCPTPRNQGKQGSCVAWASAYAARTILEARKTGKNPDALAFSPSFMYNQISIDHSSCQGSYIKYAMDNMLNVGAVDFNDFRYDPNDCNRQPSSTLKSRARSFKIEGFQRLTEENRGKAYEILAIKQNLSQGSPVIIGMMVGGSFMQNMVGNDFWEPTSSDYSKRGFGGHAMCIVAYDDYYEGGAFQIMNSWGTEWGNGGFAWVRYSDFKDFNVESYGLYPLGDASSKEQRYFTGSFGIQLNANGRLLPMTQKADNYFETTSSISQGEEFKVELTNNVKCYTYIFGEEVDGSSYVLFPYTKKHSPFCGIKGTRLFPRDYSMVADDKGSLDKIAIVITKKPVDYDVLNQKINTASGSSYQEKLRSLVGNQQNVNFQGDSELSFKALNQEDQIVYFTLGIRK